MNNAIGKRLTIALFIIGVIIVIGAALNWKHKHDAYQNCINLTTSIYYLNIGKNPYTNDLQRQYYNNQMQSQYTNGLNNCKTFLQ
jgi:predicted negative regulator of RcsB-dependent stress response